ncbi:MAG: serpin family protein [Firmicutes bacterium]|nr:serpin family protein [Bacillota bacterium]
MKKEDLYDAVTNLPDKYVKEAKKRKIPRWTAAVAVILTVVILLSIFLGTGGVNLGRGGVQVLAAAEYPQMAAYPNELKYIKWNGEFDDEAFRQVYDRWRDDLNDLRPEEDFADGLETYFPTAARALLSGSQGNRVCSPLNVYMALAMLAEITDGDTRQEILAALAATTWRTCGLRRRLCGGPCTGRTEP